MQIDRITRKVRLESRVDSIRYQLVTELVFLRRMSIIESDLTYLVYLGMWGPLSLKDFCYKMVVHHYGESVTEDPDKYMVRVQTVRNRINFLEKKRLVNKEGKGKKLIMLSPGIPIKTDGNVLLEYNFLYVETKETKGFSPAVSERVAAL